MKCIGQDMLDDDSNGLDEGLVGSCASHKAIDVIVHLRKHEDSKRRKVVPGVGR